MHVGILAEIVLRGVGHKIFETISLTNTTKSTVYIKMDFGIFRRGDFGSGYNVSKYVSIFSFYSFL